MGKADWKAKRHTQTMSTPIWTVSCTHPPPKEHAHITNTHRRKITEHIGAHSTTQNHICTRTRTKIHYLYCKWSMMILITVDQSCLYTGWKASIVCDSTLRLSVKLVGQHCNTSHCTWQQLSQTLYLTTAISDTVPDNSYLRHCTRQQLSQTLYLTTAISDTVPGNSYLRHCT